MLFVYLQKQNLILMKLTCLIILSFLGTFSISYSQEAKVEVSDFYKAISSDNLNLIENELTKIKDENIPEKEAYQGTLLMKKAGLSSKISEKLSSFKEGHLLLEEAIKKDNSNAEFRFLRLIIQENAPHFLDYYENLDEDSHFISKNINTLSASVKLAIGEYIKKSKVLTLHD